jgi:hypothetical protein
VTLLAFRLHDRLDVFVEDWLRRRSANQGESENHAPQHAAIIPKGDFNFMPSLARRY